ncbi:MAG: hypothetical protein E6Q67_03035 [Roseateles sp.]|nr:MAG: hypothetical protein E6Q67_03035 [Roseateles sp.]
MELTQAQRQHVAKVYPECRADMAAYLAASAEVIVRHQREVEEAGQFAIEVRGTDFWIDCCNTKESAVALAQSLGLSIFN